MAEYDLIRAVVVKLHDGEFTERAWVACTMSDGTYDVIGEEDWQKWRTEALDLCLADWRAYETREVVLRVPQAALEALFSAGPIDVEVQR